MYKVTSIPHIVKLKALRRRPMGIIYGNTLSNCRTKIIFRKEYNKLLTADIICHGSSAEFSKDILNI